MIKRIIKNIACFGLQTSSIESQSGFTLVELLVAMTIGAALSIGLVMTVRTVFSTNSSVVNHVTAINQVQNAVDYISRDSQAAQAQNGSYVSSISNSNAILTFTIPQLPNGEAAPASIMYTVNNGTLTRNGQLIATNIPSGGFTVDVSGTVPYVSITSTVTGYRSATATRIINLEP
jgi:prepilin-type N-terminal cleavage/methylation domain-containing protein